MVALSGPQLAGLAVAAIESTLLQFHALTNRERIVFAARLVRGVSLLLRVAPGSRILPRIEEVACGLPSPRKAMLAGEKRSLRSNDSQTILATQHPLGQ